MKLTSLRRLKDGGSDHLAVNIISFKSLDPSDSSFIQHLRAERPSCTHLGSLPLDVYRNTLAVEERRVGSREVWILKQDALLQTLQPQLLE